MSSATTKSLIVSTLPAPERGGEGEDVLPGVADQRVVAALAVEHVVAGVAVDRVGELVAGQVDRAGADGLVVDSISIETPGAERVADARNTRSVPSPAPSVTLSPALST